MYPKIAKRRSSNGATLCYRKLKFSIHTNLDFTHHSQVKPGAGIADELYNAGKSLWFSFRLIIGSDLPYKSAYL